MILAYKILPMRYILSIILTILPFATFAQSSTLLQIDASSFVPVQTSVIDGVPIDKIATDPSEALDRKIENLEAKEEKLALKAKEIDAKIILVEIHAEATAEKLAMGYMLDGKVSAVWGTHTHVPTADAQILPGGTGYVTDLGMTGPSRSVLGIRPDLSISKFRGDIPNRYQWANGPTKIEAVLFTIDTATGKCRKAERVDLYDENSAQR